MDIKAAVVTRKIIRCSLKNAPKWLIFLDFVPFHIWKFPVKPFLDIYFEKIRKSSLEAILTLSIYTQKFEKSKLVLFFYNYPYFFLMNLNSTWFQLSFEVYNLYVAKKSNFSRIEWNTSLCPIWPHYKAKKGPSITQIDHLGSPIIHLAQNTSTQPVSVIFKTFDLGGSLNPP